MEPIYYVFGCLDIPNQFSDTLTVDVNTIILVIGWTPLKTNSGSLIWTTSSTSASVGRKFFGTYHLICSHVIRFARVYPLRPAFFWGVQARLDSTFFTFWKEHFGRKLFMPTKRHSHEEIQLCLDIWEPRSPFRSFSCGFERHFRQQPKASKRISMNPNREMRMSRSRSGTRMCGIWPTSQEVALSAPTKEKSRLQAEIPCESIGIIGVGLGHLVTHVSSVCQVFFWTAGEASKQ